MHLRNSMDRSTSCCCIRQGSLVDNNEIKNPAIHYDPNAATPFVDIINTTLWLEWGS